MDKVTNLEEDYLEEGETEAIYIEHQCDSCGRWVLPFGLANVEDNTYWPHAHYVCGRCYKDFNRELNHFVETLSKSLAPSKARVNEIKKQKRSILNETLWATATDGTVTDEEKTHWLAYRAQVAAIDPENFEGWPTPPE